MTEENLTPTQTALTAFVERAVANTQAGHFSQPYDEEWLSPCEVDVDGDRTLWRPARQTEPLDFSGLSNAAEAPIHQDIQDFYSMYWSGTLQGKTDEGNLSLIQVWNLEDFTRLLENLVGHLFHKIRAKQPFTIFFANTEEDSEFFLSVDNDTGVVLLEEPGRPPIREIAPNLTSFLSRIEPDSREVTIY